MQVANQPGLEDVLADLLEYEQRDADDGPSAAGNDVGAEFYSCACPAHLEGGFCSSIIPSGGAMLVVKCCFGS